MKIINSTSKKWEGNNLDYYDFDKLSSLDDVKEILQKLKKINFQLKNIYVSEFGDYEDAPMKRSYSKEQIDSISVDYSDKIIELYKLIGTIGDMRMVATIYPEINRLEVEYSPSNYSQLQEMISELDTKKNESMNSQIIK